MIIKTSWAKVAQPCIIHPGYLVTAPKYTPEMYAARPYAVSYTIDAFLSGRANAWLVQPNQTMVSPNLMKRANELKELHRKTRMRWAIYKPEKPELRLAMNEEFAKPLPLP